MLLLLSFFLDDRKYNLRRRKLLLVLLCLSALGRVTFALLGVTFTVSFLALLHLIVFGQVGYKGHAKANEGAGQDLANAAIESLLRVGTLTPGFVAAIAVIGAQLAEGGQDVVDQRVDRCVSPPRVLLQCLQSVTDLSEVVSLRAAVD